MEKAVDVEEVMDSDGSHYVAFHHQVVVHHIEDMPGNVAVGGYLLE